MNENAYQPKLIKKLEKLFPGCFILKNDSAYRPGVPDLVVLFNDRWAMLEVKKAKDAEKQPNQEWYVELLDGMSFAAFIYPENEKDVLNDLQQAFGLSRSSCVS